jgi:hypothetical protein
MDEDRFTDRTTIIYLVLSTLAESGTGEAPESYIYLPINQRFGTHLDAFQNIVGIAADIGWLERRPGPTLRITDDGRRLVRDVETSIKAQS